MASLHIVRDEGSLQIVRDGEGDTACREPDEAAEAQGRISPDHPSLDGAPVPPGRIGQRGAGFSGAPQRNGNELDTDERSTTRTFTILTSGNGRAVPTAAVPIARPSAYESGLAAVSRHEVHIERVWPMRSPPTASLEDSSSAYFQRERRGTPPARIVSVGGLRMNQAFAHEPVMVDEVVDLLRPVPPGLVLDATVGGGGHAAALLDGIEGITLLGIDRDPAAVRASTNVLRPFGARASVRQSRFDELAEVVAGLETAGNTPQSERGLSGALFDLGVSSPQLDVAERGFSYRRDAPLDMRMDPSSGRSAADLVNELDEDSLVELFISNGEGRFARRIARAIIDARPVFTTGQLADVVRSAIPAATRRTGGHPARRVFQAIRIAVNDELGQLQTALDAALELLRPGGRCVVIAYHSGEDRLVKATFARAATGDCRCPPGLPCVCGAEPEFRLVRRAAKRPSAEEVGRNRRAEAARLRAIERLPSTADRPAAHGRVA